jgi:hypothetical protein
MVRCSQIIEVRVKRLSGIDTHQEVIQCPKEATGVNEVGQQVCGDHPIFLDHEEVEV